MNRDILALVEMVEGLADGLESRCEASPQRIAALRSVAAELRATLQEDGGQEDGS